MISLETLSRDKLIALAELKRRGVDISDLLPKNNFPNPFDNLDNPVKWIEDNFYISEGDGRLHLDMGEYRKFALTKILTLTESGNFPYSTVIWSDIKKSAKSTIAGAIALWMAFSRDYASIKLVANDLKQADSREAYYIRRAIQLNPNIAKEVKVNVSGYRVEVLKRKSTIEAIPVDPSGEAGGNDDLIIFTELWAAKNEASKIMWSEMTLSPTKYGKSFRLVETYAGFSGESPLLENLYEQGVTHGTRIHPEYEIYENREAKLFCMWNTVPRLDWQTENYYDQERAIMTDGEFKRVHRNQWGSSTSAFLSDISIWDMCREDVPMLTSSDRLVMALDGSVSRDTFGLVAVSRLGNKAIVRLVRAWQPEPGRPLDFNEIEQEIKRILTVYKVVSLAYDKYQLHQMMQNIREFLRQRGLQTAILTELNQTKAVSGGELVQEFSQQTARAQSDSDLLSMIKQGRIAHDGHALLRQHISNANLEHKSDGKIRLIKRNDKLKIDLAVTLSMAVGRAMEMTVVKKFEVL